jgi:hypothetical protein
LARLDRRRKKRTSNRDWQNPFDPDAKITKMKDGRTHLAHKAEHAVDLDSGALVAVTLQGADVGDTTSLVETAIAAAEQVEAAYAASATPWSVRCRSLRGPAITEIEFPLLRGGRLIARARGRARTARPSLVRGAIDPRLPQLE